MLPDAANEHPKGRGKPSAIFVFVAAMLSVFILLPAISVAQGVASPSPRAVADTLSSDSSSVTSGLVSYSSPNASSRIAIYRFPSQVQRFNLPDSNIFVGSERVRVDGRPLSKSSYFLDCGKGELFLSEPAPPSAEITVEYRFLPISLKGSYCLRPPDFRSRADRAGMLSPGTGAAEVNAARPESKEEGLRSASSGLRLRGTKTLSLEIGSNRDATLKQSLDMNVTGEISKGLDLTAVLTDRDLPIQAEGKTEALNEIDEIRVELQSQAFKAALGDCNFVLEGPSLLNVSRKLEGAQARGTVKGVDVVMAGSTLKGKWVTRDFLGTEGRQGPYEFTTDAGASCVVIAGTEKVWLDGTKLRRGESADYWVDYNSGNLYFTNRRPITGYSRISVEYEYATGDYEKNFYAAGAAANLAGGLGRVQFTVASEADQKAPESGALTDEEEKMLKELGDAPSKGTIEGAVYVGSGKGDYDLVSNDSTGVRFFKFLSEGGGSYDVSFVDVGEKKGAYSLATDATGKVYYTYAGLGNAEYNPGRRLVSPSSKRVEDIGADVSAGGFDFKGELALSETDLNTFSSLDDGDNFGKAGTISLKSRARGISLGSFSLGRVSLEGNFRSIDDRFRTFGNINSPFEYESWALADSSLLNRGEKRLEGRANYSPWQTVTLTFQHGELSSNSGINASRNAYSFERAGKFSVSGRIEKAVSHTGASSGEGSSRTVSSIASRLSGWRVVPFASYYSETKENGDGTGEIADEVGGGLSSAWNLPVSLKIEEKYRIEYLGTRADHTRSYDAVTHSLGMEINRWRSVSASCEYSIRDLNGYNGLESVRTELGKLFLSQSTASGRLSYEINHLVTTLNTQSRTKNIIYAGVGAGSYDSTGTFRGKGDYNVEIIDLGSSTLSADATTSGTLSLKPFVGVSKDSPLQGLLESIKSSSLFRSSGTLRGAPRPFSLLISPMYTESHEAIRSDGLVREELEMAPFSKKLAVRYRWELSSSLYHQYENVVEKSWESNQGVRLRGEPARALTVEMEQLWRGRNREVTLGGGAPVVGEAVGTETSLDLRYVPLRAIELSLAGSLSGLRDTDSGSSVRVSKFSPSATYGAGGSTRARLALTLSSYVGDVGVLAVGTAGAFVSPNRVEIVFSLDHAAGQHLTISSSVSSRKSTETFVTDGRVEMRAYF